MAETMGRSFDTYLASCPTCHMYTLKAGDTILVNGALGLRLQQPTPGPYADVLGSPIIR